MADENRLTQMEGIVASLLQATHDLHEVSRQHDERLNTQAQASHESDARIDKLLEVTRDLHQAARQHDERLRSQAQAARETDARLDKLVELSVSFHGRMEELRESQANTDTKIAALTDAQMRTEEAMANLTIKMAGLADQHAHTDQRLDALIDIVREGREGRPPRES